MMVDGKAEPFPAHGANEENMMKTNYLKLAMFSRAAQTYLADENNKNTKLGYALKRVVSQLDRIQAEHNQRQEDISIDNAATDANGVLLIEADNRFRFTPEGLKNRNKQWRELNEADNYEIEPHFCVDVPELPDEFREAFQGFVIQESKLEAVA